MAGNELPAVGWYRSPIEKETLRRLTGRSDVKGLLQCLGFVALTVVTGATAFYAWRALPVYAFVLLLFLHGTVAVNYPSGFHELTHGTMFRTKWLNAAFLRFFSFMGWISHVHYKASHVRHHLYTLHPPSDLEVVLPMHLMVRSFLLSAVVDIPVLYSILRGMILHAFGKLSGPWDNALFPASDPKQRRRLFRWARITLLGHAAIVAASIATGLWPLALIISGARFYGGWLAFLLNNPQHIGLQDNVADFRLCTRTILVNPVYRFLYFHMSFHAEHHMYASVPCYNLAKLRRAIVNDMPKAYGLVGTWKEIIGILRRQKREPGYQHILELPAQAAG